jgi:transposase
LSPRAAGALNVDETGWYLGGESRTLWGAFSKRTAVLRIAPDRGKQHLHGLIGERFAGVVGSDRFSAYNSLEPERRQVCWSHPRRDFTFHADLDSGQMWPLLEWGSTGKRQRHVRALAKNLLKLWPALWTFADVDDVEPTNNAAKRAAIRFRR